MTEKFHHTSKEDPADDPADLAWTLYNDPDWDPAGVPSIVPGDGEDPADTAWRRYNDPNWAYDYEVTGPVKWSDEVPEHTSENRDELGDQP